MAEEMTCVLCGGPADQVGRFCTSCVGDQGRPAATTESYQLAPAHLGSIQALRWPLIGLLVAGVGIAGVRAGESWALAGDLSRLARGGHLAASDPQVHRILGIERQLSLVQVVATVAIGAVFLVWWALAYRNLTALGVRRRSTLDWAVASWFVPFVSLVAPKRVAEELYWGSDAETPLGWSYTPRATSSLVTGWWVCWIASAVLPSAGLGAISAAVAWRNGLVRAAAASAGAAFIGAAVLLGLAGLGAAALVAQVTAGQVDRARAIVEAGLVGEYSA